MDNKEIKNERYFKFSNGVIFKYNLDTLDFYYLTNEGIWIKDENLKTKYYDASSDYYEITLDEVRNFGRKR